jgi:hypothetical protein
VKNAKAVRETSVSGTRKYQLTEAQLLYPPQALKWASLDDAPKCLFELPLIVISG